MLTTGLVFAALAALVHVYIFVLESLRWMAPATRRTFGIRTEAEAQTTKALAYNQGWYNLLLAVMVGVGIVLVTTGALVPGVTLVIAGCAVMLGAALVLVTSRRSMLPAALIQGTAPTLAIAFVWLGLL